MCDEELWCNCVQRLHHVYLVTYTRICTDTCVYMLTHTHTHSSYIPQTEQHEPALFGECNLFVGCYP